MIGSNKIYTHTHKKRKDGQNSRTNGKRKAIQKMSHKVLYTCTLTKIEKGKKYIHIIYIYINLKRKRATKSINKSTNDNKL